MHVQQYIAESVDETYNDALGDHVVFVPGCCFAEAATALPSHLSPNYFYFFSLTVRGSELGPC